MKIYVRAGVLSSAAVNLMKRMMKSISQDFKDVFKSDEAPKSQKIKDPDTGMLGTLYTYSCANEEMYLNVEMYPFPGANNTFILRCYCSKGNQIQTDTIKILNTETSDGFKPIRLRDVSKKIEQYADDFFELLGSFEDADQAEQDMNQTNDDGFEPSQYEDDEESEE